MKRWIVPVMILLLVLGGCNTDGPDNTNETTTPGMTTQQPTVPPVSLYVSGSMLEEKTHGAVKVYAVEGERITGIDSMDGDILVFAYDGAYTTITRLSGQEGLVMATTRKQGMLLPAEGGVGTGENKLVYFDAQQNAIVILDGTFHEVDRVKMPGGATSTPVLSSDLTSAFYCAGNEIRALDLVTEIPRLVCRLNVQQLRIVDLLLNDEILHCHITDADGNSSSAFYSTETGEKLGQDGDLITITAWDARCLVQRMDGPVRETLLGDKDGALRSFGVSDTTGELYAMPVSNGILGTAHDQRGITLTVYETNQGNALGSVTLEGLMSADTPLEDPSGQYIWFCAADPDTGKPLLCRWEYAAGGSDGTVRIGVRHTAQNPDTEGLSECEKLAGEISKKYGVTILLGDVPVEPEDYTFVPEYQVSAYKKALSTLDEAMARFPDDFFKVIGTSSENPRLQINLVREIVPGRYDVPDAGDGHQYWIDEVSYMALEVCDQIEQSFYHELCHAMGTYVSTHSSKYTHWSLCNPEGFQYDNSYTEYATHSDSPYLQGEDRAFIDAYSMTYPHEDRATVFEYAMTDGCEDHFTSDTMQKKLSLLCEDIRRAFGWRYYEGTFPWEQYLKESQAYVDKK